MKWLEHIEILVSMQHLATMQRRMLHKKSISRDCQVWLNKINKWEEKNQMNEVLTRVTTNKELSANVKTQVPLHAVHLQQLSILPRE